MAEETTAAVQVLIKKRGNLKAQLTKLANYVKEFNSDQFNDLFVRESKIHGLYTQYSSLQDELDLIDSKYEADREAVDDQYFGTIKIIQDWKDKCSAVPSRNPNVTLPADAPRQNNPNNEPIRLPTVNLPTFVGTFSSWKGFRDIFSSLIHENKNLRNVEKFHYLKSCLKADAARAIESFSLTGDNYNLAWAALEKRFNNTRLIVQEHVCAILNLQAINKSNHSSLQELLDKLNNNLNAIKGFQIDIDAWNALIVPIITAKLDFVTKRDFELTLTNEVATLAELLAFLEKKCSSLESLEAINHISADINKNNRVPSSQLQSHNRGTTNKRTSLVTTTSPECISCKGAHFINYCPAFKSLTVNNRYNKIKELKACVNCLKTNHSIQNCLSPSRCKVCQKPHHSILHFPANNPTSTNSNPELADQPTSSIGCLANCKNNRANEFQEIVLLSTIVMNIKGADGVYQVKALLDNGSQNSFINEKLCRKLQLPCVNTQISLAGITNSVSFVNKRTKLRLHSRTEPFNVEANCLVVKTITNPIPQFSFDATHFKIPHGIQLADPNFNISSEIELLIGSDLYWDILKPDFIRGQRGQPHLQNTCFGYILAGSCAINASNNHTAQSNCHMSINHLDQTLSKFWEVENLTTDKPILTPDEVQCETHFERTHQRLSDGRFQVNLPFNNQKPKLGYSRTSALKRFYNLENKLDKDCALKAEYSTFLKEYLTLGHMRLISDDSIDQTQAYFIPHHMVIKDSLTTRLRVVFDASMPTHTRVCLNDVLHAGPNLQQDLFLILCRFRTYQHVLNADIAKMFRQIRVAEEDTKYQLILWRENKNSPIDTYQLQTVTYGLKCSPYLAMRVLHQLAEEEKQTFPEACKIITRDFFMDDLLSGADTIEQAMVLRVQLTKICEKAGFVLRKWASNTAELLTSTENKSSDPLLNLNQDMVTKTLGIGWNCQEDNIRYIVGTTSDHKSITKRSILSTISRIYDPLGLLQPVIAKLKIIMQQIWISKVKWDDPLPSELLANWKNCIEQLETVNHLKIPRKVLPANFIALEMHGFSDASNEAYGCCIYLRATDSFGNFSVHLLCAKSRVNPLRVVTIPRCELLGAHLLAKQMEKTQPALNRSINKRFFWTDSNIVLAWLSSHSNVWSTFVANRVSAIQTISKREEWHHISGQNNPADIVSRGLFPEEIQRAPIWWHGPHFLSLPEDLWPIQIQATILDDALVIPERRKNCVTCLHAVSSNNFVDDLLGKFSSFSKLQRVVSFVFRFIEGIKRKNKDQVSGSVTPAELDNASIEIIKAVQRVAFPNELNHLKRDHPLNSSSKLLALNPFLDKNGVIRVGGRLRNAPLGYNRKFPILLPSNHHVTELIVKQEHIRHLHAGGQATLAAVRQKYWPIAGRDTIRKFLYKCITCFRNQPRNSIKLLMGDLPKDRLVPGRPFATVSLDYAGPILIKSSLTRSKSKSKAYICIFVCLTTKAVHLEIVTDLSTETFLNCLKRFIGRRGIVSTIISDNATCFRRANKDLSELNQFFKSKGITEVQEQIAQTGIKWKFNPARSPHFGGLVEAAVKSTKFHLKRVIGETTLNYEEFNTLIIMIEAVLNSRPLTPLSSDPNDLEFLTPGHLLIGAALTAPPQRDVTDRPINRLSRFQQLEKMRQHFWRRWSQEYLSQLQVRSKWQQHRSTPQIQPGALVILRDNNTPPLQWPRGRILYTHPGTDGVVRVVSVKTANGNVLKRAVKNVCFLPIEK